MLDIVRIPVLQDNYIWLVHEPDSGETMVVDPAVAAPVLAAAKARGWSITAIWNTHWHPDHTGGNAEIKAATGCTIIGPAAEHEKIPTLDVLLHEGDVVKLGGVNATVMEVPAHTAGHIAYHFATEHAAFVGDTLFAMGCGRLFEGTPAQMSASLAKLMVLPGDTRVCCTHEYTMSNLRFAAAVEPGNAALTAYTRRCQALRDKGEMTLPSSISTELAINPFVRCAQPEVVASAASQGAASNDPVAVFAAIREWKNSFR